MTDSTNNQKNTMQIQMSDVAQVAEFFSIVHHIPGRIRIRVNVSKLPAIKKWASETSLREILSTKEAEQGDKGSDKGKGSENFIITLLQGLPAVKNIKVNAIVGSATIEYDKALFAPSLWENWVQKENLEEIHAKLNEFSTHLDS